MSRSLILKLGTFLLLILFSSPSYSAALKLMPTGPQPTIITPQDKVLNLYSSSYALVISVSEYGDQDPWVKLPNTEKELDNVSDALRANGFEVHRVTNPDADELAKAIKSFLSNKGRDADSRILFFYSGHGYYDKETNEAYLVPIGAMKPSSVDTNFYDKAYAIEDIKTAALRMPAKHGMFIFDNCFSGMVFKADSNTFPPATRGATQSERWRYLRHNAKTPVLQFISAGGPDQLLPAVSIFATAFVQALKGGSSKNNDGYVTGKEIGMFVSEQVTKISRTQTPYSDVLGKVLGDMVFQIGPLSDPDPASTNSRVKNTSRIDSQPSSEATKSDLSESTLATKSSKDSAPPASLKNNITADLNWRPISEFKMYKSDLDSASVVQLEGLRSEASGCRARDQRFGANGKYLISILDRESIGVFRSSDGKLLTQFKHNNAPGNDCTISLYDAFFDDGNKVLVSVMSEVYEHYIFDPVLMRRTPIILPKTERIREVWPNPNKNEFLVYSSTLMQDSKKPRKNYGGDGDIHFRVFNGEGEVIQEKTLLYNQDDFSVYQKAYKSLDIYGLLGQSRYGGGVLLRRDNIVLIDSLFKADKWVTKSYGELGCGRQPNAILARRGGVTIVTTDDYGELSANFSVCAVDIVSEALSAKSIPLEYPKELTKARHYLLSEIGGNTVLISSTIYSTAQERGKRVVWGYDLSSRKSTSGFFVEIDGVLAASAGIATTWFSTPDRKSIDLYVVRFPNKLR